MKSMQKKQNMGKAKDVAIICAGLCCSGLKSCRECKECQQEWVEDIKESFNKKLREDQKQDQSAESRMRKPFNEWKDSEDKIERTVYFINYLSPHNFWKGYNAIEELLSSQKQNLIREVEGMKKDEKYLKRYFEAIDDVLAVLKKSPDRI